MHSTYANKPIQICYAIFCRSFTHFEDDPFHIVPSYSQRYKNEIYILSGNKPTAENRNLATI